MVLFISFWYWSPLFLTFMSSVYILWLQIYFNFVSSNCNPKFLAICMLFLFLSRSLSRYNAYFLAICMLFLLHIRSLSLCAASFPAIRMYTLFCCCSYSLNSGRDLARFFHSVLYCCLLSFSLTYLSLHISLAALCTLLLSEWFFLALSAKSFCDCKYLSTIACASEGTFVESTTAHSLFDNSPLFDDMHDAPPRLLFDVWTSVLFDTHVSTHLFDFLTSFSSVALASRLRTLSSFCRCVWLFFLTFGMTSIFRFHFYLSAYKWSYYQEFEETSKQWILEDSLKKVGHIGLSRDGHVTCCTACRI